MTEVVREALHERLQGVPVRSIAEHLAERLDADAGRWRLLFELEDGNLRFVTREEFRIPATALGRFGR